MVKGIKIGRLRDWVSFEQFAEVDNEFGEPVRSWTEYLGCRAQVLPAGADERIAEGQELSRAQYTIRIRSSSASRAITSRMRAVYDGQVLDISPPRKLGGRDRYLELTAVARSSEQ
ncbi:phage head closure protein [Microbulbifer sp. JSM ZJ756]|uniref:phage head closure protein n=1 Tax=Microbulbifer sp. JSM ZJ756 TaxID=3376191 RepID=UPI00379F87ED